MEGSVAVAAAVRTPQPFATNAGAGDGETRLHESRRAEPTDQATGISHVSPLFALDSETRMESPPHSAGTPLVPSFTAGDAVTGLRPSHEFEVITPATPVSRRSPSRVARTATDQQTRDGQGGASGPLETGQSFGPRYHIIRVLGVGGMGAVYQAWDAELGVAVAVKVIRPEIAADPIAAQEIERRFKRELLLARQVTHKNVVRIHDLGEIDGIKYITMPFVDGSDLATILKQRRASWRFPARCASPGASSRASSPPTTPASSIATSSPPTS